MELQHNQECLCFTSFFNAHLGVTNFALVLMVAQK